MAKNPTLKSVESLTHAEATRKNIPTAEHQSIMHEADKTPIQVAYERRNRDLDPQLVWRGKDERDWSGLVVQAPPLYIQEKVHPKVQCIYFDPPYGIKFNSNFQWRTTSRDVKDGKAVHITREPEQVKAVRDIWRDGIHSYLTYLRDRLTVARDLLTDSGSIFVQIGDENVHRVRALMDEVFGDGNFVSQIMVWKTSSQTSSYLSTTTDYILWFAKDREKCKFRRPYVEKNFNDPSSGATEYKYFWNGFGKSFTNKEHDASGFDLPRFRPSPTTSHDSCSGRLQRCRLLVGNEI